jgi:hypothetical protein
MVPAIVPLLAQLFYWPAEMVRGDDNGMVLSIGYFAARTTKCQPSDVNSSWKAGEHIQEVVGFRSGTFSTGEDGADRPLRVGKL